MAEWGSEPIWTPFEEINGGQQFSKKFGAQDLNALAENIAYLYENRPEAEVPTVEEWDGTGVVIEGLVKLISFTINGTSCQAEDGMLWMDWIMTDYNTVDAFRGQISETTTISLLVNGASQILQLNGTDVKGKDAIVSGASYTSRATTGTD